MLNFIARDLHYFGLQQVVDVSNKKVTWTSSVQLGEHTILHGSGASPDAALASVLNTALADRDFSTFDTTLSLDQLADDLLQLVLTRSPGGSTSDALWRGVGRFRQQRAFWFIGPLKRPDTIRVTGSLPDEVLDRLVRQAFGK